LAQSKFKLLHTFRSGNDGSNPYAGLTVGTDGSLYGTTVYGGGAGQCFQTTCGTAFRLIPNPDGTWSEKVIYSFSGFSEPGMPYAGLIWDSVGNLYGTTEGGGGSISGGFPGTIFELSPNPDGSWAETTLTSFGWPCGSWPYAGAIRDATGNLYTTVTYSYSTGGAVCQISPSPYGWWTVSVVYQFTGGQDGATPYAGLVLDEKGNLYGTTYSGGGSTACFAPLYEQSGCGTVFELTANTRGGWNRRVIQRFSGGVSGANPVAGLTLDSAGNLYGTTSAGGAYGHGNVFELTPNPDGTWTPHALHQFTGGKDGASPVAGLIFDSAGNLYGTTANGGAHGYGNAFKLMPGPGGTWIEQVLHQFTGGWDGANPDAPLVLDNAGNLYGTTYGGGNVCGCGVIFEITP
jgi:uncharacterized repeat protein (TIGR03803 family)